MKRKIIVSLIVILVFALATMIYDDGANTSPDIIRFGFPFPFQETFTGKSFDPNLQRQQFFHVNLISDILLLLVTIYIINTIVTATIHSKQAKKADS